MSVELMLRDVVRWSDGTLVQGAGSTCCNGVGIDTRSLEEGRLFFAIRGPNHDAHAYLVDAVARGASALVVEEARPLPPELKPDVAVVSVRDTTRALGAVAAGHRSGFHGPLVAISGSNGKTTTKEMCAAILERSGPCLRTRGNLNNAYGLPLTLLGLESSHRTAVVEIGMNHRGEIRPLADIARPDIAVITNVGTAHIEFLGSQDEIAAEKGDLLTGLADDGVAVLNADDARVLAQKDRTGARVVTFGSHGDFRALSPRAEGARGWTFRLACPEGEASVVVAGLGEGTIPNALAAAAAACAAGASLSDVSEGLGEWRPVAGRMQPLSAPDDVTVLNDSYNANPQSVGHALRALVDLAGDAATVAVLGDMGELGDAAADAHRSVGELAAGLGIDRLFAAGALASEVAAGARAKGMDAAQIVTAADADALRQPVKDCARDGAWVLVKGSRSMRMERIVWALTGQGEDA